MQTTKEAHLYSTHAMEWHVQAKENVKLLDFHFY